MFDPTIPLLGLGAAGDIFGAYSAHQQQQRQRDLYNKMLEYNNPAAVLARQQQFYQANVGNLNQQIPDIMRQTVNPMLGMKGIDPGGGQGQMMLQQSLAPYYLQAWQQAGNQAQGGLNALQQAGGQVGTPYGTMGGTGSALQSLMLMQALRGGRGGGGASQTPQTDSFLSSMPDNAYSNLNNPTNLNMHGQMQGVGPQLNFGLEPFQSAY